MTTCFFLKFFLFWLSKHILLFFLFSLFLLFASYVLLTLEPFFLSFLSLDVPFLRVCLLPPFSLASVPVQSLNYHLCVYISYPIFSSPNVWISRPALPSVFRTYLDSQTQTELIFFLPQLLSPFYINNTLSTMVNVSP